MIASTAAPFVTSGRLLAPARSPPRVIDRHEGVALMSHNAVFEGVAPVSAYIVGTDAGWPEAEPIPAERVLRGAPATQTVVTARTATSQSGLWRVTEGEFTTDHQGYVEFFHVVDGEGELVHDDGTVWRLTPGVSITMADGWRGRWMIQRPLVKTYAILRSAA
jgi:uncharacterized protein